MPTEQVVPRLPDGILPGLAWLIQQSGEYLGDGNPARIPPVIEQAYQILSVKLDEVAPLVVEDEDPETEQLWSLCDQMLEEVALAWTTPPPGPVSEATRPKLLRAYELLGELETSLHQPCCEFLA